MRSGCCLKCGRWTNALTEDHIIFRYLGGGESEENKQMLCRGCNSSRSPSDEIWDWRKHREGGGWGELPMQMEFAFPKRLERERSMCELDWGYKHGK